MKFTQGKFTVEKDKKKGWDPSWKKTSLERKTP